MEFDGTRLAPAGWFAMGSARWGWCCWPSPPANTAILFTTNTVLSSLIGVTYLEDRVCLGFTAAAIVGFVCAIAGTVGTAHYASIASRKSAATTRTARKI